MNGLFDSTSELVFTTGYSKSQAAQHENDWNPHHSSSPTKDPSQPNLHLWVLPTPTHLNQPNQMPPSFSSAKASSKASEFVFSNPDSGK